MKGKRIYSFAESMAMQRPHRKEFIKWLASDPKIKSVEIGTYTEDLQGIDFWITDRKNSRFSVQLKVDAWADITGNLPCETISKAYSSRCSRIGAEFNMAKVDFIFFLLVPSCTLLGYRFKEFLQYVIENYKFFKNFAADNDNGNDAYRTLGCLIPIKELAHIEIVHTKIVLSEVDEYVTEDYPE
jgi:hypothetical protein